MRVKRLVTVGGIAIVALTAMVAVAQALFEPVPGVPWFYENPGLESKWSNSVVMVPKTAVGYSVGDLGAIPFCGGRDIAYLVGPIDAG